MGDGTGLPCFNNYVGPGSSCACRRFFVGRCDAPPFWEFSLSSSQTGPQWSWMNGQSWLQKSQFFPSVCHWSWKYNDIAPYRDLGIEIIDNPDYGDGGSSDPFRMIVRAVHVSPDFQSEWFRTLDFGDSFLIYRDAVLWWDWLDFFSGGLNSENAVRPVGTVSFSCKMCQPGWIENADPR